MATPLLHPETQIFMCLDYNPKVPNSGTWHRFNGYFGARTVGEALKAGVTRGDILWDVRHGFILLDWDCPHAKAVPPRGASKAAAQPPAPDVVQAANAKAAKGKAAPAKATKKPSSGIAAMVSQLTPAKAPRKAKQVQA